MRNIFETVHIEGFRRLHDVDLELNSLNVVIGANGGGKTSLLDVFSLLAASAAGRLKETMSEVGGIESNLTNLVATKGDKARFMAFKLGMRIPGANPIEYRIATAPHGVGYEIVDETLTHQRDKRPQPFKHIQAHHGDIRYYEPEAGKRGLVRPNWDYNPTESALSQVPKMFQEPEDFRKHLASSTHYHVLDVSRRAPIRLPQQMRDAKLPGHDGEDLVSCLYTLRETDPDRFETIEATLRAGCPDFERLNFPPVAAGTLAMTWKDKTSKNPFYMHQLSEGTLRFLWLTTLLQSPGLTSVTMIDEPEVSLHPDLLLLRLHTGRSVAHGPHRRSAMRIAILVEGKTEKSFKSHLIAFLSTHLAGKMPKLDFVPYDGRIPTGTKLRRVVENLLSDEEQPADAVIALTDVYTGSNPPEFPTAQVAKQKMRQWVGVEKRFHPHVALHDFEAWLLPYWKKITKLTGSNHQAPGTNPEAVNHGKSPAYRLADEFRTGPNLFSARFRRGKTASRLLRVDAGEEIEVAAAVGLQDVVVVKARVATLGAPKPVGMCRAALG